MTARVLAGSKQEIAQKIAQMEGNVCEAIVFVDDPPAPFDPADDIFAEMESITVQQKKIDDSRESIYERRDGE